MNVYLAYVDSSVLLREILDQKPTLSEWDQIIGITSELTNAECRRVIDRMRARGEDEEAIAAATVNANAILPRLTTIPLDSDVLEMVAAPFPKPISTLDAIHLVSAMIYRSAQPDDERPIYFATFDKELADAARAVNFDVLGA